jgi:hypothetical protein
VCYLITTREEAYNCGSLGEGTNHIIDEGLKSTTVVVGTRTFFSSTDSTANFVWDHCPRSDLNPHTGISIAINKEFQHKHKLTVKYMNDAHPGRVASFRLTSRQVDFLHIGHLCTSVGETRPLQRRNVEQDRGYYQKEAPQSFLYHGWRLQHGYLFRNQSELCSLKRITSAWDPSATSSRADYIGSGPSFVQGK